MRDGKIRAAVAGCGYIGHRHIDMIEANPEMELAAVADVRAGAACGAPAGVPFFPSVSAMLAATPGIDIAAICTPNGFHADMAVECLAAGVNVLMEKPMALSRADALRIREAERASGKLLLTVFQNRYTPASEWLHGVVHGGLLGRLTSVNVCCLWNRDNRYYRPGSWHGTADLDGGVLYTQFSHYLDILLWLVGPVDIVAADFADFAHHATTDFEDTGTVLLRTRRDGALGTFYYTTAVPGENLESSITLVGTRGCVKVAGQYMSDVAVCRIDGYSMPSLPPPNPPNDYGCYKGSAANHSMVYANAADVLLRGAAPTATWADGIEVVSTIDRIYALRRGDYSACGRLQYVP